METLLEQQEWQCMEACLWSRNNMAWKPESRYGGLE